MQLGGGIARTVRRRLIAVALLIAWGQADGAQEPLPLPPDPNPPGGATPAPAPPRLSVEERLERLEAANQQLLQENRQLRQELRSVSERLGDPPPTAAEGPDGPTYRAPRRGNPGAVEGPVSRGAAAGGGDLMAAPALGGRADRSLGPGADVLSSTPSRGASFGGGDLISFDPNDPDDAAGVAMVGRFGRRFVNNGLWFESPDKVFQFHVGGRYQMDASFFDAGNTVQYGPGGIGKLRDGVDPRRMRVRFEGAMWENLLFCSEFDFINSSIPTGTSGAGPLTSVSNTPAAGIPVPLDLWVTFRNIPYIGHIRIGNQKEPMGFERLTSSRFLNFMERSFNQDAFYAPYDNGFVPGISMFSTYANRRGTWAVGVFKNVSNPWAYDVGGGNDKVTGRVTYLLLYGDEGRRVMHVGLSARQSGYDNGQWRFRVRGPERAGLSSIWPLYANTGVIDGSGGMQDVNIETANVFGPWTVDAEYNFHWSQNAFLPGQPSVGTLMYSGGYVEVMYFLTGENRTYIRESGLYDRVIPRKNAYWVEGKRGAPNEFGWGAWQVGLRYNYLNLNDKGIDGGALSDITLGLNWFINPNMKFQWNYSVTGRHLPPGKSDGMIQGFGTRFAFDY